ncbi:hypothetical protein [Labilibaculum euxinus]
MEVLVILIYNMRKLLIHLAILLLIITFSSCDKENHSEEMQIKENEISRLETKYGIEFKNEKDIGGSIKNIIQFQSLEDFEEFMQKLEDGIELKSLNKTKIAEDEYATGYKFTFSDRFRTIIRNTYLTVYLYFDGSAGVDGKVKVLLDYSFGFIDFDTPWDNYCSFYTPNTMVFLCKNEIIFKVLGVGFSKSPIVISGYAYLKTRNVNVQMSINNERYPVIKTPKI